ncbi:MAG: BamA/TamA family outer membrane protein [Prevotellaceae bacterium]|nr:BamA/TamA family outer membrane protein [Candidatus Colivivens equi]
MKICNYIKNHECWPLILSVVMMTVWIMTGCSTTSNMQDGEYLYTGIKSIVVKSDTTIDVEAEMQALEEVKGVLSYAPNNSFMGSSSVRVPLPIGLWIQNELMNDHEKGLKKWMYNSFASTPVTISAVAPETRVKVATNTLQNHGYFQGYVDYEILDQNNPKKKKVAYNVNLGKPYILDSIQYVFPELIDSIRIAADDKILLHKNDQFNAEKLQNEKNRITELLRNKGFYFYRPDYISFFADSTMSPQKVQLLVVQDAQTPDKAKKQWTYGNVTVNINGQRRVGVKMNAPRDSVEYGGAKFFFTEKCPISPNILRRNFRFRKGRLFSQDRIDETITNLSNMQIFSQMQFSFSPRDTTAMCDTLDVRLDCTMDKLIDAELDLDVTQKSNAQVGPRVALTLSKRNAFGHGETFSVKAKGSYEWQTRSNGDYERIDSYEAGLDASIKYPWLVFPSLAQKRFRYATSSQFKVGFDHLKRAGYYREISFQVSADYSFMSNRYYTHRLTPLSFVYNKLEETTARFDSIVADNQALLYSLRDQFIPSMGYTIIYDNDIAGVNKRVTTRIEAEIKEAGNVISGIGALFGNDVSKNDKKLLNVPYAQFLKVALDVRHKFRIGANSMFATKFYSGAIWSYGNSIIAPYTEQFYVGGANDIRAFGAHTIGPGRYYDYKGRGTYLDQAGCVKLQMSAEYRFPIVSNLHGAVFVDAGNVWTMSELESHPGGQLRLDRLWDDIATGTGVGLRYNLDILVLRLDMGIALHAPYDTGKSGYYNIRTFWKDGVGLHFAVGYPF